MCSKEKPLDWRWRISLGLSEIDFIWIISVSFLSISSTEIAESPTCMSETEHLLSFKPAAILNGPQFFKWKWSCTYAPTKRVSLMKSFDISSSTHDSACVLETSHSSSLLNTSPVERSLLAHQCLIFSFHSIIGRKVALVIRYLQLSNYEIYNRNAVWTFATYPRLTR